MSTIISVDNTQDEVTDKRTSNATNTSVDSLSVEQLLKKLLDSKKVTKKELI